MFRITDHPNMTSAVYCGCKVTNQSKLILVNTIAKVLIPIPSKSSAEEIRCVFDDI